MQNVFFRLFPFLLKKSKSKAKKKFLFSLSKREKFVIAVSFLSLALFIAQYFLSTFTIFISVALAIVTDVFLFLSLKDDMQEKFSPHMFVLPFLYSLSFGLFYFLIPSRLLVRFIVTTLYAFGLYSLFLSENIFTVSLTRTIALLHGARITTFVIASVSYFLLANIIMSLHAHVLISSALIFILSFFLIGYTIWTYTLEKSYFHDALWVSMLSVCLCELSIIVWFWPTSPTVVALFLTGLFYALSGLSHVWIEKRLFRGVLWEYIWVSVFSLLLLIVFTNWQG